MPRTEEISKEDAKREYAQDDYVLDKIQNSKRIFRGVLNKDELENSLVLPWENWGLFRMIKRMNWCKSNVPYDAFTVQDASVAFLTHQVEIKGCCDDNVLEFI